MIIISIFIKTDLFSINFVVHIIVLIFHFSILVKPNFLSFLISIFKKALIFYASALIETNIFSFSFSILIKAFKFFYTIFIINDSFFLSFPILRIKFLKFISVSIKHVFFSMFFAVFKINKKICSIIHYQSYFSMAFSISEEAIDKSRIINCNCPTKSWWIFSLLALLFQNSYNLLDIPSQISLYYQVFLVLFSCCLP